MQSLSSHVGPIMISQNSNSENLGFLVFGVLALPFIIPLLVILSLYRFGDWLGKLWLSFFFGECFLSLVIFFVYPSTILRSTFIYGTILVLEILSLISFDNFNRPGGTVFWCDKGIKRMILQNSNSMNWGYIFGALALPINIPLLVFLALWNFGDLLGKFWFFFFLGECLLFFNSLHLIFLYVSIGILEILSILSYVHFLGTPSYFWRDDVGYFFGVLALLLPILALGGYLGVNVIV